MAVAAPAVRLDLLARAATRLTAAADVQSALATLAEGLAAGLDADLVVVRVADADGALVARAVAPGSSVLGAELVGSRAHELPGKDGISSLTRRVAARGQAST